ncbi:MAG: DUF6526 family protein [Gemmatimonadales bacterium]
MASEQSYKNHTRWLPPVHFFVVPVLLINVFVEGTRLFKAQTAHNAWVLIVAIALAVLSLMARTMALAAQDRTIRLEERLRLGSLMPENQRARINDLTPGQLVGLRFASDAEAAGLAQRCLAGELKSSGDVKRAVTNWRADHLRV